MKLPRFGTFRATIRNPPGGPVSLWGESMPAHQSSPGFKRENETPS